MIDQIPTGFQGFIYDQADRERRLEAKKWEREISDFRRAASYLERGEDWLSWYLLPYSWSLAGRELPSDLLARMEYVSDSLKLAEPGSKQEAAKLLHEAGDALEGTFRERFGLAGGWMQAAE